MKNKIPIILFIIILITFLSFKVSNNKVLKDSMEIDNDLYINKVISNKYIENGINLEIEINNTNNPKLLLQGLNNKKEISFNKISNNLYNIDINLEKLANDNYKMYIISDNKASQITNELDILEKLVRSKIGNKLVTFTYDKYMVFSIEDFKYEYDIFIDPGHGGIDGGTYNELIDEDDLNLLQSMYEKNRFEEHGLKVLMSRSDESDGMLYDNKEWNRAKRRAYLLGYYGVTSKIIYSNHHNSTTNDITSGYEIIVSNSNNINDLKVELKIIDELNQKYPIELINNKYQIYSRDLEDGIAYNKINGKVYDYKDYYATIRIPLELFNVKTVTYEGCYMSNITNFDWYYKNEGWKIMSEIKIKNYVESLGKTYIPV